jgi:hypothetical protein
MGGGALLGAGGGVLSALGQDQVSQQLPYEKRLELAPASELEQQAQASLGQQLGAFGRFVGAGPGQQDITSALTAQRGLAQQFAQAAQTGGLPTQADITAAGGISQQLFAPQQIAMQQQFLQQQDQFGRQAAALGRATSDPILQAKMRREQSQAFERLGAQQGATAQQIAMQLPGQRLQYAQQGAGVLQGLATQAMKNRLALAGLGQQISGAERQFRLGTATQSGFNTQMMPQTNTLGAIGAGLSGGLAGAGFGANIGSMFPAAPPMNQAQQFGVQTRALGGTMAAGGPAKFGGFQQMAPYGTLA